MRKKPIVRYVRILVKSDGISEWFTSTLCIREMGVARTGELTIRELEQQCQKAAQVYGNTNVEVAMSDATSLQSADFYFSSMVLKNSNDAVL